MSLSVIHSTPDLEAEASKGNKKYWAGYVLTDDAGGFFTQTAFWQQTADGLSQRQFSAPTRVGGKNLGRANETTPEQQARFNMDSLEKRQRDKGYHEEGENTDGALLLPMLAHEWGKRKHSVRFPLYAQPKLDGCRCLFDGRRMWSRKGKPFLPEVWQHLMFDTFGFIMDGELMLPHGRYDFQTSMSAVKRFQPELSGMLEYHVYDCYLPNDHKAAFEGRFSTVLQVLKISPARVIAVQTEQVDDEAEIARWHTYFTSPEQGYEGTILRTPDGIYTPGHRSVNLLKHKDFLDSEFEIVAVGEGKGKFEGAIMFTCVTPEGRSFDCGLTGSMEDRREMFDRKDDFIGKLLKVKYQNLTEDGIPRFPVGLGVRDSDLEG